MDSHGSIQRLRQRVKHVTPEDAKRALQDLSSLWGHKIDVADIDSKRIFSGRLGPTHDCLTLDKLVELDETSGSILAPMGLSHWSVCPDCREAMIVYQSIKDRLSKTSPPAFRLVLDTHTRLEMPEFMLQGYLQAAEPIKSLKVKRGGLFKGAICHLEKVSQSDRTINVFSSKAESVYRVWCETKPVTQVCSSLSAHQTVADWVELLGITTGGKQFTARGLTTFENACDTAALRKQKVPV